MGHPATYPSYAIYDNTTSTALATITMAVGTPPQEFTGTLPIMVTPGDYLLWRLTQTAVGCTTNAANVSFTAQFN